MRRRTRPQRRGSPRRRQLGETGRRRRLVVEGDDLPGRPIGEQGADEPVVERVPRLERAVRRQQRVAGEHQVADGVEDLVLDELVVVAQAVGVEQIGRASCRERV